METFVAAALIVGVWLVLLFPGQVDVRRSFRSLWRRPSEDISVPADERSFRGGARLGFTHAPWPLAKLSFDRNCAVIRIGLIASVAIRRSTVVDIALVPDFLQTGIRFVGASGEYNSSLFLTSHAATVLRELQAWGWPVEDGPDDETAGPQSC